MPITYPWLPEMTMTMMMVMIDPDRPGLVDVRTRDLISTDFRRVDI